MLPAVNSAGPLCYALDALEPRLLLSSTKFAVIGDYGNASSSEAAVATMVKGWNPDYILTTGDNNYDAGDATTIDPNIGQYYHDYIYNYQGIYGAGSLTRRFFPVLGNHDWGDVSNNPTGADPYLAYFDLPGNERYYDFAQGPAHFFMIDSDSNEPDGVTSNSVQAQWLHTAMSAATEPFKIVVFHHPDYSSGGHGNNTWMQWPFAQWGASAVLYGHDHVYERLLVDGIPHITDGVGGRGVDGFSTIDSHSKFRWNDNFGAMLVNATDTTLKFQFYSVTGQLIDTYTISPTGPLPSVSLSATDSAATENPRDNGIFTLTRTGSTGSALNVSLLVSGTATNGSDYSTIATNVTIPAGAASVNIPLTPINDALAEGDETATLTISPSDTYNVEGSSAGTITIADDDVSKASYVASGNTWKYLDDGSNQGTAWRGTAFNDSLWLSGPSELGYGDGDEATVVNSGPPGNKYITTYFRKTFSVADASLVAQLNLQLLRDDGAVVYINGVEAVRSNMPGGTITSSTGAASVVGGTEETTWFPYALSPSVLVSGVNTIAVEIHQSDQSSSDISFNMKLDALVRSAVSSPVLNAASDSGISSTDGITKITAPTFSGLTTPGMTVHLFSDGVEVGTALANGSGAWQITSSALTNGTHSITATASNGPGGAQSAPSTALSVVIDTVAPTVGAGAFLFDNNHSITFQFNEDVSGSLAADDLSVRRQGDTSDVSTSGVTRSYASNLATFTFPSPLANGTYHGKLLTSGVTDAAGNAVASDGGFDFFVLAADGDRNGKVDILDFNILATNFGKTGQNFRQGNYDYSSNTKVDILDFNILATTFGQQVTVPTGPASFQTTTAISSTADPVSFGVPDRVEDDRLVDVLL